MKLTILNTPYKKRMVIEYAAGRNDTVRRWHSVQHIAETLYKGTEITTPWDDTEINLYCFFPGVLDGIAIGRHTVTENSTVESLVEQLEKTRYASREKFIEWMDKQMESGLFIGRAEIRFVSQWAFDKALRYADYRKEWDIKMERERAEQQAAEEAESRAAEARERQEKAAKDREDRMKYYGWADGMTPLKFGQTHKHMNKVIRCDGKLMSYRDFIIDHIANGWIPSMAKNVVSWYGSKWNPQQSKKKTEYRLCKGDCSITVSKTAYDFAQHMMGEVI